MITVFFTFNSYSKNVEQGKYGLVVRVPSESKEDKELHDIYIVAKKLYQELIEITVLYHMYSLSEEQRINIRYNDLVKDLSQDVLMLSKMTLSYFPMMLMSKDLSWKIKLKKSLQLLTVVGVSYIWSREYCIE